MPTPIPPSLQRLNREILPLILRATDGRRALQSAAEVVQTDRWNSFDRFHETSRTLVRQYEKAGAGVEVEPIQTGGRIGSGRWIIHQAQDLRAATVEVVSPLRQRLLDYSENPWHAIQWTAGTPREGLESRLVILDSRAQIERLPAEKLRGRTVLTCLEPRRLLPLLADRGAAALITDHPVPNLPDALAWSKFGWGAIPMSHATARLVGLVLSQNQGRALRRLARQHGELTLHLKVEVRQYVGTHDVVSGLIRGGGDPQDEVWVIAHSSEPGAVDNASGVALCLEMARVLEGLIAAGRLPRPRRTIRLLNAYECYGFFAYLERVRRLQPPLAGVCIDTVASRPEVCDGRLEWHSTIPMSAGFVDWVGEKILRAALRRHNPGYRLCLEPFMSTSDTLIGDPQYGYPCPWITTHHRRSGRGFDAYHSSGDTLELLSAGGLKTCAAAMATYGYFLADAGSREVVEMARSETRRLLGHLEAEGRRLSTDQVQYVREAHRTSMQRLQRWLWGGERGEIMARLAEGERAIHAAAEKALRPERPRRRMVPGARRVPRRTALLSPDSHNTLPPVQQRLSRAGLNSWALFWADGRRTIDQIARLVAVERSGFLSPRPSRQGEVEVGKLVEYFEAHAELGYVELGEPREMVTRKRLVAELRELGLEKGMDLMVHSSLSAIGWVEGGAETVVDALLESIGKSGTLLMPSFNHRAAQVFNPMTTPTTNGAIPEAMWRRPGAVRSLHPTHAVAALGARAAHYCGDDHLEVGIWAADSPIGRLVHGGGYILALGTTHQSSTAYHVAEMSIPCGCIDSFANTDKVVATDGRVRRVPGLAFRAGPCPVPIDKIDRTLDRRGLQRRGKVGEAEAEFVRALDLWQVRREHIRRVCPRCEVKPAIRR